jgi:5-methylcytosine-specific restriction protein B
MSLAERQQQFVEATQAHFGTTRETRFHKLFGVSNSATIVEGGIQLGVANLHNDRDTDAFVFACVMKFPPEDEVYFSVLVRKDRHSFQKRLLEMKQLGANNKDASKETAALVLDTDEDEPDDNNSQIKYSNRNNLVPIYIAGDGRIYLRNAKFWDSLAIDLTPFGPGIEVDKIIVAIYPPTASARRSLLAREFIGWLGNLIGREKIHELRIWNDTYSVSPEMRRLPHTIPVAELVSGITELGGHYPGGEIERFHAASNFLEDKHFVILSGLSGTGKTQLATHYARAVHGVRDRVTPDPFLFVCPVRPEWTDPSGLTGYYDVLSNRYMVPPFLEAVLVATAQRESPVFVMLDEMNLARVEYYFSDVLSCIETGEPLQLHSSSVPLEGSTGTSIRAALPIPPNLYIIGTINIDETTNPVSDKVLDRAVVIDMSSVDMSGFLQGLSQRETDLQAAVSATSPLLTAVHQALDVHRLGFGYRVAKEVVKYQAFAAEHLNAAPEKTLDDLMVQKILVKLRGSEKQRPLLTELSRLLKDMPRSQAFLEKLTGDLNDFGSFQASR